MSDCSNMQCRAAAILEIRDICVSCTVESLSGPVFVQRVSNILDKFLLDSVEAMMEDANAG